MKRGMVVLALSLSLASSAHASPGDPHLVQGTLEWPAKLTVEPFVVVRGEDGRWYYAELKAAKRLESTPLTAGARVAILGTEAARPHEITAIAIGPGDAAALAMALMPHVSAPAASTPPAASAPSPPPTIESPSVVKPAKPESSQAPKTSAKPEPPAAPAPAPTKAAQPAPADSTPPADPQLAAAPRESPTPAKRSTTPTIESAPSAKPTPPADASSALKTDANGSTRPAGTRWSELRGTVDAVAGHWVVIRADDGQLVLVDFSAIRGASAMLKLGSPIAVYGTAGEQRFQAIGLVQHETRPPAKSAPAPLRR